LRWARNALRLAFPALFSRSFATDYSLVKEHPAVPHNRRSRPPPITVIAHFTAADA